MEDFALDQATNLETLRDELAGWSDRPGPVRLASSAHTTRIALPPASPAITVRAIYPEPSMSEDDDDNKEPNNPFEDLQKQVQKMLRSGNFQFITPGGAPPGQAEADEDHAGVEVETEEDALDGIASFDRKPREVKDYLDRFVIKQDEAKKVLAVAVCDHYNHVRRCLADPEVAQREYTKQNVILLGPTGSARPT